MVYVKFFAQVREWVGVSSLALDEHFSTVEALRQALMSRGEPWALALASGQVLVAVNQTLQPLDTPLQEGDEVAFFPPVTGG